MKLFDLDLLRARDVQANAQQVRVPVLGCDGAKVGKGHGEDECSGEAIVDAHAFHRRKVAR